LITDFNLALTAINAVTYELPSGEFGTFATPNRISLTRVPMDLWSTQLARELAALRGVLRPDLEANGAYRRLFYHLTGVSEDLTKLDHHCKCDKLFADYTALRTQAYLAAGMRRDGMDRLGDSVPYAIR